MKNRAIKRALISVHDKSGVVEFARALVDDFGMEILSTGGTARLLKESAVPVTLVEEVTGTPEMIDGRVKSLHPHIHAAILADRDNPEHMRQLDQHGIKPIDLVVVNLYPFEETVAASDCTMAQAIEMIDIGGPCLLRAAAKNHRHVLPVCNPDMYESCLEFLRSRDESDEPAVRRQLAAIVFDLTSEYDAAVQCYLGSDEPDAKPLEGAGSDQSGPFGNEAEGLIQIWDTSTTLRYGENPHQQARFYGKREDRPGTVSPNKLISGDAVSFNNYRDADAAWALNRELAGASLGAAHAVCIVKHTNPCGVGIADNPIEAYRRAYLGDPNAAMGGVLACSFDITAEFAEAVMETFARWGKTAGAGGFFVEVWTAPSFAEAAVEIIRSRKRWGERVRLLAVGNGSASRPAAHDCHTMSGGMLAQSPDLLGLDEDQWRVATKRTPSDSERTDLRLAWLVCKHTKSNAVTICKDGMMIGNGPGQTSRVMSCRIATWLARDNGHAEKLNGAAAASDAFFPFPDGPAILMDAGVRAIIQPGGSKRDQESIAACDKREVAMILTGTRHFKH